MSFMIQPREKMNPKLTETALQFLIFSPQACTLNNNQTMIICYNNMMNKKNMLNIYLK
jgi:hypothetical protein